MKLQLALDRLTREECFQIIKETEEIIDWIEIGTSLIKEYGMSIVKEMKHTYPEKMIVADMKTCDSGRHEAEQVFNAGADITTVMAFSAKKTVLDALQVAAQYKRRIMIDLLGIQDHSYINELKKMGIDLVSIHYGKDMQTGTELNFDTFNHFKEVNNIETAVAGGINENSLKSILRMLHPNVIIVGSGITKSKKRYEAALKVKEMMAIYEKRNSEYIK